MFKPRDPYKRCIRETFRDFPSSALSLIDTLLAIDPAERKTATDALNSAVSSLTLKFFSWIGQKLYVGTIVYILFWLNHFMPSVEWSYCSHFTMSIVSFVVCLFEINYHILLFIFDLAVIIKTRVSKKLFLFVFVFLVMENNWFLTLLMNFGHRLFLYPSLLPKVDQKQYLC